MIISTGISQTFDCAGRDSSGAVNQGVGAVGIAGTWAWLNIRIDLSTQAIGITSAPYHVIAQVADGSATIGVYSAPTPYVQPIELSWVWTSHIGAVDFTETLSGEVTKQPMSWYGYVYQILKIASGVIVYGANGITQMMRSGLVWGRHDLYPIGIKGKYAAVRTRRGHYFIDKNGKLGQIAENGALLITDYSNYFSSMSAALVMSYDESKDVVYICDGTYGYVLSEWGLGKGPANITGIGSKAGTLYAGSLSGTATFAPLEVTTDIQDFGSRDEKMIDSFQIGMYAVNDVYGAIDYRWDYTDAFFSTPWVQMDKTGTVSIMVTGIEFKFKVKMLTYEATQIDYIRVNGMVANSVTIMGNV